MSADQDRTPPQFEPTEEVLPPRTEVDETLAANLGANSLAAIPEDDVNVLTTLTPAESSIVDARFARVERIMKSRMPDDEKEALIKTILAKGLRAERDSNRFAEIAHRDELTGALRKGAFVDELRRRSAESRRANESVSALLILDADRFKPINDTYGHATGDQILVTAVEAIRENIREDDVIGRLGGDEFGAIVGLPHGISAEDAHTFVNLRAEQINKTYGEKVKALRPDIAGEATLSIGHVLANEGASAEALLHEGDMRMYEIKHSRGGRNSHEPGTESAAA